MVEWWLMNGRPPAATWKCHHKWCLNSIVYSAAPQRQAHKGTPSLAHQRDTNQCRISPLTRASSLKCLIAPPSNRRSRLRGPLRSRDRVLRKRNGRSRMAATQHSKTAQSIPTRAQKDKSLTLSLTRMITCMFRLSIRVMGANARRSATNSKQ